MISSYVYIPAYNTRYNRTSISAALDSPVVGQLESSRYLAHKMDSGILTRNSWIRLLAGRQAVYQGQELHLGAGPAVIRQGPVFRVGVPGFCIGF